MADTSQAEIIGRSIFALAGTHGKCYHMRHQGTTSFCRQNSMSEAYDPTSIARIDPAKVEPIPVRFWWLKRILIVSGIALAGLVALRVWWGWEAHRRLQAEIEKYIAAGEPIYPEDFDQEPVHDDENAAKMLDDAVAALNLTLEHDKLIDTIREDFSSIHEHIGHVHELIEANAETLRLVRAARHASGIDWDMHIRYPAISSLLPKLSGHRKLSKVLSVITAYYHATGDEEAGVDILRDAFAHADAIEHQPFLMCHLVAISANSFHAQSVESVAPNLQVDGMGAVVAESVKPTR